MTKGKMRRLAVCAAAAVILAVTVLTAGPVRASQSGFAKISYEKMYLALNDVNNVIQAYQDTSDGSVAYCLNSALESPDGGQSYGNAGNGTGRISEAGMAAVRLVIGDGYPLNARYWTQRGIPEDAQRQATQLAIWAVLASLGEADSNADYFAYDYAVPINLQDVDAASMYRTLAGNALSGVQLPRSVSFGAAEISADASAGTVSVRDTCIGGESGSVYSTIFRLAEGDCSDIERTASCKRIVAHRNRNIRQQRICTVLSVGREWRKDTCSDCGRLWRRRRAGNGV